MCASTDTVPAAPTRGWCGRCGLDFALAPLLEPPAVGRCPRCDRPLAPSYDALLVDTLRAVLAARRLDARSADVLRAIAPRLHLIPGADPGAAPGADPRGAAGAGRGQR